MSLNIQILFLFIQILCLFFVMINSLRTIKEIRSRKVIILKYRIGANSKGGVLVERDAVDDVATFEQKYAKTDAVIVVNSLDDIISVDEKNWERVWNDCTK